MRPHLNLNPSRTTPEIVNAHGHGGGTVPRTSKKKSSAARPVAVDKDNGLYPQIPRLLSILQHLSGRNPTMAELAEKLNQTERTAARFVQVCRRAGVPISSRREDGGPPKLELNVALFIDRFLGSRRV